MDKINTISTCKSISSEQRSKFLAVIDNIFEEFIGDQDDLGQTNLFSPNILTGDHILVKKKEYQLGKISFDTSVR